MLFRSSCCQRFVIWRVSPSLGCGPYTLQAVVAPLAFGFCSIIGAGAVVLISDYAGLQIAALNRPLVGLGGLLTILAIYFVPGVLGTWLAISITGRLRARISK
jgi:hypothetical protein